MGLATVWAESGCYVGRLSWPGHRLGKCYPGPSRLSCGWVGRWGRPGQDPHPHLSTGQRLKQRQGLQAWSSKLNKGDHLSKAPPAIPSTLSLPPPTPGTCWPDSACPSLQCGPGCSPALPLCTAAHAHCLLEGPTMGPGGMGPLTGAQAAEPGSDLRGRVCQPLPAPGLDSGTSKFTTACVQVKRPFKRKATQWPAR